MEFDTRQKQLYRWFQKTPVLGDLAMITRARNAFQKRCGVGLHFRPRSAFRVRDEGPHNSRSHKRR